MATVDKIFYSTLKAENLNHTPGNPNALGVYGERGWTCQDWSTGALYVYGESAGPDQWLPVMTVGGPASIAGSDGDILNAVGGYWTPQRQITDENSAPVMAWYGGARLLYDGTYFLSVDFGSRVLVAPGEFSVINWNTGISCVDINGNSVIEGTPSQRMLYDLQSQPSVDFNERLLYDSFGVLGLDFANRAATDETSTTLFSWANVATVFTQDSTNRAPRLYNSTVPQVSAPLATVGCSGSAPASGATVTPLPDATNVYTYYLSHPTTIATLTLNLTNWAANVPDGASFTLFSRSAVTTLTLIATGFTIVGPALTSLAANQSVEFRKYGLDRDYSAGPGTTLLRVR